MDSPDEVSSSDDSSKFPFAKVLTIILAVVAILIIGIGIWYNLSQSQPPIDNNPNPDLAQITQPETEPTIELYQLPTSVPVIPPRPTIALRPTIAISPTIVPTISPTPTTTPTPTPNYQTLTITSTSNLDGFRSSNNGGNNTIEIRAGRNSNLTTRGFVSFDIPTGTLSGKTIDSVKLRLYQYKFDGNPYGVGGSLLVDSLDYGSDLATDDYDRSTITSGFATLTSNAVIEWKDANATAVFKADLTAGHSRSQYRLRFATEAVGGDDTGDFAYFYSSNTGSNTNPPQLEIHYH